MTPDQVVWTHSGVRPLYNDGAKSATAATRDHVLSLMTRRAAPVECRWRQDHHLSPLAESAGKAGALFRRPAGNWTPGVALFRAATSGRGA